VSESAAPTERLYYTDAYRREFRARIVDRGDGGRRVYLDVTAFYPTSGGQPHDIGTLGGARVMDVIDEGDRIAHLLDGPSDSDDVSGAIDWERRFDFMQQHTGQHLLSSVFEDQLGLRTVSVHFGDAHSTLDLEGGGLGGEKLVRTERRANELIAANHPVTITFEDAAAATGLRKAVERGGTLRIVSIEGLDRSACGGTHVRSTAEIGCILLRGTERIRDSVRVEFLCGLRAIRAARADHELLNRIAATLSAAPSDIDALVTAQATQVKTLQKQVRALEGAVAISRVASLYEEAVVDSRGVRQLSAIGSTDVLRGMAQEALKRPKLVFVGLEEGGSGLVVAASEDSGLDAGKLLREAVIAVGGKGGGSPRLAQGAAPSSTGQAEAAARLTDALTRDR
jgi:alanyl-tRNA synthetase